VRKATRKSGVRGSRSAAAASVAGVIVLDPGHGGTEKIGGSSPNNAAGPSGLLEKTVTLAVALRTAAALKAKGHQVRLTRDSDVNLGLKARATVAQQLAAPVFVSIHFNGDDSDRVQGTETWVHAMALQACHDLATIVQRHVVGATGYRDRGVKGKPLDVLAPSFHSQSTSACLVEISFLTDPADEARLREEAYLESLGQAVATGILDYLGSLKPGATVAAAAAQPRRRTARAAARAAADDGIKHVVVLMLENRSFDHMLGSLRAIYPALDGIDPDNPNSNVDPEEPDQPYFQKPTSKTAIEHDPKHEACNVDRQINSSLGRCGGFVNDFKLAYKTTRDVTQEVMGYFEVGQVPALHRLASEFTVCDHWFSSVPAPTWTNRLFAHSGTSLGRVEMPKLPFDLNLHRYNQTTLYDRLNEQGISWRIFYGDVPQSLVLEHQRSFKNGAHYERFTGGPFSDSFAKLAAGSPHEFPQFVFIEPSYFINQNDQHPTSDVIYGDLLIARVFNAIRRNEGLWAETLFVILHDEHGGFYDHVFPGPAVPPDNHAEEYTFDQYGVRVPAVLVSPWVGRGVLATEFDHTSLLRYVSDKWSLGALGARTAVANSFASAILATPRTDTPGLLPEPDIPRVRASIAAPSAPVPLNDLQRALVGLSDVLEYETTEAAAVRVSRSARLLAGSDNQAQVAVERVERFLAERRGAERQGPR
jgi:N-acetylmuramoyl-L-alanine amidase